jgi:hypothetical protein
MKTIGIIISCFPALLLVVMAILQALGKINIGIDADAYKKILRWG